MGKLTRFFALAVALLAMAPFALAGDATPAPPQVPEPGILALIAAGAAAFVLARRRKRD